MQVCDVLECKADTIEIEESVEADEVETAIIGVTTATGCNPGTNSPPRFSIEGVPPKKKICLKLNVFRFRYNLLSWARP